MTKQIEAVYENGVLRPVEPIELPEGERLSLILITRDAEQPGQNEKGDITRFFGSASLGHPTGTDNESIDRDLAREYGSTYEEPN
jgi:predicted DNA-binding antitoxin AbrB/MazE fold protein